MRIETTGKTTASLLVTPKSDNYDILMRYTCEGLRMKLDSGEFSVTGFEMQEKNLMIWLEEV